MKIIGRLTGDGKGNIKNPAGRSLTEGEAAEHLRLWEEMLTPDEETAENLRQSGVADMSEEELIEHAKRVQKEVRQEKRKR